MSFFDIFERSQRAEDSGRLARIETKLDLILSHLGIEFQPFTDEVRQAADSGNKIRRHQTLSRTNGIRPRSGQDRCGTVHELSVAAARGVAETYMNSPTRRYHNLATITTSRIPWIKDSPVETALPLRSPANKSR